MEYMNIDQKSLRLILDLKTSSALAAKLAKHINTPQLIELVGDLGGGKTAFTKALGKALGVKKTITSPTFNIHRSYEFSGGRLEHFDLYRLNDDEYVLNELQDCLTDPNALVVVEWAQNFHKVLDKNRLVIKFEYVNENIRSLVFSAVGQKSTKLLEVLK